MPAVQTGIRLGSTVGIKMLNEIKTYGSVIIELKRVVVVVVVGCLSRDTRQTKILLNRRRCAGIRPHGYFARTPRRIDIGIGVVTTRLVAEKTKRITPPPLTAGNNIFRIVN